MTAPLVSGYEVVCPDGHVRHYPYFNEGDATCDAEVFDQPGRCVFDDDTPEIVRAHGPCRRPSPFVLANPPDVQVHQVRPIVFQPPPPPGAA